jgi:hypothetical protein
MVMFWLGSMGVLARLTGLAAFEEGLTDALSAAAGSVVKADGAAEAEAVGRELLPVLLLVGPA